MSPLGFGLGSNKAFGVGNQSLLITPQIAATPLLHYNFSNTSCYPGSGTSTTNLGSGTYPGTLTGTGATFDSGSLGGIFTFDGTQPTSTGRIIVDTNSSVNSLGSAFTIEFWGNIYMSDSVGGDAAFILDARNTNSSSFPSWYLYETDINGPPRILLQINLTGAASTEFSTTKTFTPNQYTGWTHFVFGRSGTGTNQAFCYVNGSLDNVGTSLYSINSSHTKLHIGNNSSGTQQLKGSLQQIRFYNRALSTEEIYESYLFSKSTYGL